MTPEQQKALALANARLRLKGGAGERIEEDPMRQGTAHGDGGNPISAIWDGVSDAFKTEMENSGADPLTATSNVLSAGFTSGVNAVPFVGPKVLEGLERLKAGVQGRTYEDVAATDQQQVEDHPVASTVGSVAGPTVALAPLGMTSIGARLLGLTGSTGYRVALGGLSGGTIAGGDSLSRGNSPQDALLDAALGTGIGAGLPVAAKGLGWLGDLVTGRTAPREAQNIARALRDDDVPVDQINQRLQQLGPDAMVMDLGPNAQSQAGAVASIPGPGQRIVREAVRDRARGGSRRVTEDVRQTIGSQPDIEALRTSTVQAQEAAATPLYDAIRDVPIEAPPQLRSILQRPQGQQAIRDAVEMAANDGYHFPTSGNVMTVGLADYIKRALDDMATAAARTGRNNEARTARNMARAITASVDRLEPRYRQAREAYAGPAAVIEALDSGATAFSREMSPPQLRRTLQGMSASERDAYLQGARSQIEALMGNAVNDVASLRNTFRKGWNEQKLRILLGDDIADDLLRRIDRELAYGQTSNAVASNSETARRTLAQEEIAPSMGAVRAPRGRTFLDLVEGAFNAARNGIEGVRRPQINHNMARLQTATQLAPEQLRLIQNGARATRPGTLPPAAVAVIEQQRRREPVEIVISGGNKPGNYR